MQWVLDLFDKHKVSTRDVTDRYKAFGTGQGGHLLDRPWTLNGYLGQKLNFQTSLFPNVGGALHHLSRDGWPRALRPERQEPLRGDHGGGEVAVGQQPPVDHRSAAAPRRASRSWSGRTTRAPAAPWAVRGAFVDGMAFATEGEIPVRRRARLCTIYSRRQLLGQDARRRLGRQLDRPRPWRRSRNRGSAALEERLSRAAPTHDRRAGSPGRRSPAPPAIAS